MLILTLSHGTLEIFILLTLKMNYSPAFTDVFLNQEPFTLIDFLLLLAFPPKLSRKVALEGADSGTEGVGGVAPSD